MNAIWNDAGRNPDGGGPCRNILNDDGIGANLGMIADDDSAQYLGSGPDVYVTTYLRPTRYRPGANGHPLENQAIGSESCRPDHDRVGVGKEQTSPPRSLERERRSADDAPEPVIPDREPAHQHWHWASAASPPLVAANRSEQAGARVPDAPPAFLTGPIRLRGRHFGALRTAVFLRFHECDKIKIEQISRSTGKRLRPTS